MIFSLTPWEKQAPSSHPQNVLLPPLPPPALPSANVQYLLRPPQELELELASMQAQPTPKS